MKSPIQYLAEENARLKEELAKAYRALYVHHRAHVLEVAMSEDAVANHAVTVAAAARFMCDDVLDGTAYLLSRPQEEMQAYLDGYATIRRGEVPIIRRLAGDENS